VPIELINLHFRIPYWIKTRNICCSHRCVKIVVALYFFRTASLFHSCLSLEAETWRRTASLALSATDKYWVSDMYMYLNAINKETCWHEINICGPDFFYWSYWRCFVMCKSPESVTFWLVWGLFVIINYCNYVIICNYGCTWYYWHYVSFP
jgi:hypothetical protein